MSGRLVVLVVVTGCASASKALPPLSEHAAPSEPRRPVSDILEQDTPLEYTRPMAGASRNRAKTIELFHERCVAGDHYACRIEAQLLPVAPDAAYARVARDCRAGDQISCRALPGDRSSWLFPDELGAMSRKPECVVEPRAGCDLVALRAECARGFPMACDELSVVPDSPELLPLATKTNELAVAGCSGGIADECRWAVAVDHSITPRKFLCLMALDCGELAREYERTGQKDLARDAYERACQYGKDPIDTCLDLAAKYVSHELTEPVSGRAAGLVNFACPQIRASPKAIATAYPACASVQRSTP